MPEPSPASVIDALDLGVMVLDTDHRVIQWNEWLAQASRISTDDARGKRLGELFPRSNLVRVNAAVTDALSSGIASLVTHALNPHIFALKTRTGAALSHNVMIGAVDQEIPFRRCIIQVVDITAAAERERILRKRQNARYDAVVGTAQDAILTMDAAGNIQFSNPASVRQFGYSTEELAGKPAGFLFRDRDYWNALLRAVLLSENVRLPAGIVGVRKDGSLNYLEVSASRWLSDNRVFVSAILRDVNERRAAEEALLELNATLENRVEERTAKLMETEEALRQSQKMEAVGQLTGGIAHDFNNLLQGIIGGLDRIEKRISEGRIGEVDKFLQGAMASANRAAALTHRLLAFSRRQPVDPRPVDLAQLLGSIEELLRRSLGEKVDMGISSDRDLWLTRCDANQLENSLLNLVINARDASLPGGNVQIKVNNVTLTPAQAIQRELAAGEYVRIQVQDNGTGMPDDVKARAFDPFYTTKAIGQGTGLGLSMVYGFVRQSGGSVRIDSRTGKGTTIEICLPRFRGELEAVEEAAEADTSRVDNGKIVLVVEDESIVRMMIVEVLNDLGCRTLEAADGPGGLRILETSQRIDLLITDIGLPGLNGRQLADAARVKRPDMPILFMTGYAETASSADFLGTGMEMIAKPVHMDHLTARIREILKK